MAAAEQERQPIRESETQNAPLETQERTTQVLYECVNAERARNDQPAVRLRELTAQHNEQMENWIKDLASNDFQTREAASKGLSGLGVGAMPRLQQEANTTADPEVRARLTNVMDGHLGGGLGDIDRLLWKKQDVPVGAIVFKGGKDAVDGLQEERRSLESDLASVRRFTDDLALPPERRQNLAANRIGNIDQLLEQQRQGKIKLPENAVERLERERLNLISVTKLAASIECNLAEVCFMGGDSVNGKEALINAFRRDASLLNSDYARSLMTIYRLNRDEEFKTQYRELGGNVQALENFAREQEENEERSRKKLVPEGQPNKIPLAFDLSIWTRRAGA